MVLLSLYSYQSAQRQAGCSIVNTMENTPISPVPDSVTVVAGVPLQMRGFPSSPPYRRQ